MHIPVYSVSQYVLLLRALMLKSEFTLNKTLWHDTPSLSRKRAIVLPPFRNIYGQCSEVNAHGQKERKSLNKKTSVNAYRPQSIASGADTVFWRGRGQQKMWGKKRYEFRDVGHFFRKICPTLVTFCHMCPSWGTFSVKYGIAKIAKNRQKASYMSQEPFVLWELAFKL